MIELPEFSFDVIKDSILALSLGRVVWIGHGMQRVEEPAREVQGQVRNPQTILRRTLAFY
jgi:hypothetical protein